LRSLAEAGVKSVDVVCPGFSADCLETLEEIAMENRDIFLKAGGQSYHYIPALNDRPEHIHMLAGLIERHIKAWPEADTAWNALEAEARKRRAQAHGAPR